MDFLADIIARKRLRLHQSKELVGLSTVRHHADEGRRKAAPHAFRAALDRSDTVNVIAEIKRASPSRGVIRADVDPASISRSYEAGRAAAISVLTEEDRFRGSLDDLRAVREAVGIPILRKDFIFDEYQLFESAAAGADALLLIVAALDDSLLLRLRAIAEDELGMDALVEVHSAGEMRRAKASGAKLIGVNNRDLRTFDVSLDVSVQLAKEISTDAVCVSESGLENGRDIGRLRALGYRGFLVGETLMRADDPGRVLRALIEDAGSAASMDG